MSRKNPKPKDVNAPKKNISSYFIYSQERRQALQAQNVGKPVTDISKVISAEWAAMDPEKKAVYSQRAVDDKKRYETEFAAYKMTDNFKKHEQRMAEWRERERALGRDPNAKSTKGGKKRAPKKPKQPEEMPKRPQSSYFIFSNERRDQLKEQYPDKKITELSGLISIEWKQKSAEDKKKYEEQAAINKEKYNVKIAEYKKTEQYKAYQQELEDWKRQKKIFEKGGDEAEQLKISLPRKPKDAKCPKRPLTSYFLYAKAVREQTKKEFPEKKITEIAGEISKKWKVLTEEEKKPYNDEAARLKEQYAKDMAEYEGSEDQLAFKQKINEWKIECDRRKQAARNKEAKKRAAEMEKKKKMIAMRKKKVNKNKKQKKRMEVESSDESSSSDSDSDSSSSSSSDSSSSSGSSSDSDSDSSSD